MGIFAQCGSAGFDRGIGSLSYYLSPTTEELPVNSDDVFYHYFSKGIDAYDRDVRLPENAQWQALAVDERYEDQYDLGE